MEVNETWTGVHLFRCYSFSLSFFLSILRHSILRPKRQETLCTLQNKRKGDLANLFSFISLVRLSEALKNYKYQEAAAIRS